MVRKSPVFIALTALFPALLAAAPAEASERRFTYTQQSSVLGQGERELEPWTTFRTGRSDYYNAVDTRIEVEYGLTNRLQAAWYLNVTGVTEPHYDPVTGEKDGRETKMEHGGMSLELKYKLLDAVADPVGMALYLELTGGPVEAEVEGKLILDKRMGKFLVAMNLIGEQEWEFTEGSKSVMELILEADLAAAYFLTPQFALGLEARNRNPLADGDKEWEASPLFLGPVASYSWESMWAAVSVLPQVTNLHRESGTGRVDIDHHEYVNSRLIFGMHF